MPRSPAPFIIDPTSVGVELPDGQVVMLTTTYSGTLKFVYDDDNDEGYNGGRESFDIHVDVSNAAEHRKNERSKMRPQRQPLGKRMKAPEELVPPSTLRGNSKKEDENDSEKVPDDFVFEDDFNEKQHKKTLAALGIKVRDFASEKPSNGTTTANITATSASASSSTTVAAASSSPSTNLPSTSGDGQQSKPHDSTDPPVTDKAGSGPAFEVYDPSEGLGAVEYFLRQYPRRRPVPGKDTYRLLQLGWITREEMMDRYKLRDFRAWQEYCVHVETHGEHPWRRTPWPYPSQKEGNFPDSFRAHCLQSSTGRLANLEAIWNQAEGPKPSQLEEEFEHYREEEWNRVEDAWTMRRLQEDRVERGHSPFGYEDDGDPSFGKRKRRSDEDEGAPRVKRTKLTKLPPVSKETTPDLFMNLDRWWATHPSLRPSDWESRRVL